MNELLLKEAAMRHRNEIMTPYDAIMDLNGFDAICAFSDMLGGATVYVPNKRTIFLRCLEMEAVKEFNGGNYLSLSRKYGFSESHLRRMLKRS